MSQDLSEDHRCGYIAIIGRPNVGKSTLMNQLVGAKVSITSKKSQTTRHRIMGIETTPDAQYVYIDTPGFQTVHVNPLNKNLNRTVVGTLSATEVILFVVEAGAFTAADEQVIKLLPKDIPCILVINKSDHVKDKAVLMPFAQKVAALYPFAAVVPVSAMARFQLDRLQSEIRHCLPVNPPLFAEDELTDRNEQFLSTEIVREKLFRCVGDELPYTSTVIIEKFEHVGNLRRIFVAIIVERDSQKPIVIGKGGERVKKISQEARLDMEKLFACSVYLEVHVKVKSGWADNEARLRAYGYEA